MIRIMVLVIGMVAIGVAQAQQSVRIGSRLIQVGDSEARAVAVAGRPDRIVREETEFGGAVAERWTWYEIGDQNNPKSLVIRMQGGRVIGIREELNR